MITIILNKLAGEDRSATVGKLLIKAGDVIKSGDALFNAESAKGNLVVKSEYDGTVVKVLIEEGQPIKIGASIAEIEGKKVCQQPVAAASGYHFGLAKPKIENICCDVAIIGGGPGGYVAAIRAAQLGATVTLIEKDKLGGTCLNYGCIPTKSLVKSAHLIDAIKSSERFGIKTAVAEIDMEKIIERKDAVVTGLTDGIRHLLDKWQIKVISGEAKVKGKLITVKNNKIEATIQAEKIIIATGASPARLAIPGADLPLVLTSTELLDLKEIPKTLTIIGGGVIGMEFAFIFNSLGSQVTVVEYMNEILGGLDQDLIDISVDECQQRGIKLITGAKVEAISQTVNGQGLCAFEKNGDRNYAVSELILMAVGRKPNLEAIDLAELGVSLNDQKNGIEVDLTMQTSQPNIYAIGDVTNKIQLAHVASHQGIVAAENCMGQTATMDYSAIPSAVFLAPEIGVVGLCEREANAAGLSYQVSKFPFAANGKALSQGESTGFVKVISDEGDHRILGAAVVGPGATDLIATFSYYISEKIDYRTIKHLIVAHPTTAEATHEAILGITGEAIHFA